MSVEPIWGHVFDDPRRPPLCPAISSDSDQTRPHPTRPHPTPPDPEGLSLYTLSVQFLNRSAFVKELVEEHRLLEILADCLLTTLEPACRPTEGGDGEAGSQGITYLAWISLRTPCVQVYYVPVEILLGIIEFYCFLVCLLHFEMYV